MVTGYLKLCYSHVGNGNSCFKPFLLCNIDVFCPLFTNKTREPLSLKLFPSV